MRERHQGRRRELKRPHFASPAGPGWAVTLANAVALAWVTVARMARSALQRPLARLALPGGENCMALIRRDLLKSQEQGRDSETVSTAAKIFSEKIGE